MPAPMTMTSYRGIGLMGGCHVCVLALAAALARVFSLRRARSDRAEQIAASSFAVNGVVPPLRVLLLSDYVR